MGRAKKSVLTSLFGFKCKKREQEEEDEKAAALAAKSQQQPRYHRGTKVRPSDDDYYYGRNWYADPNINRRASEFIDRVHRGMLANEEDE